MLTVERVVVLENFAQVQDPEVRRRWRPFVLPICVTAGARQLFLGVVRDGDTPGSRIGARWRGAARVTSAGGTHGCQCGRERDAVLTVWPCIPHELLDPPHSGFRVEAHRASATRDQKEGERDLRGLRDGVLGLSGLCAVIVDIHVCLVYLACEIGPRGVCAGAGKVHACVGSAGGGADGCECIETGVERVLDRGRAKRRGGRLGCGSGSGMWWGDRWWPGLAHGGEHGVGRKGEGKARGWQYIWRGN